MKLLLPLIIFISGGTVHSEMTVNSLRCEYQDEPLCVHETNPRLYWQINDASRGAKQTAYRILVATTPEKLSANEGDLWDSKKVESSETIHIPYAGKELVAKQDCYWKVCVWDGDGKQSNWSSVGHWRMGLLSAADWQGAKWIAANQPHQDSTPHNGYHSAYAKGFDDPAWVQIDLGKVQSIDALKMYPTCPYDYTPQTLGYLFPVRYRIEVATKEDFSDSVVVVDCSQGDVTNPRARAVRHDFTSVSARYVRLIVTKMNCDKDGNYAFTLAEMEVFNQGVLLSENAAVTASDEISSGGWSRSRLVDGRIYPDQTGNAAVASTYVATRFRKEFSLDKNIKRAFLAVTALGSYEAYINGLKIGDDALTPDWTTYSKRIFYRVYDVTTLLRSGANVLSAEVAPGWWGGPIMIQTAPDGWCNCLKACLMVESSDGSESYVKTDTTWGVSEAGPVRDVTIYHGLTYDGTSEQAGWDAPGFSESWANANTLASPSGCESSIIEGAPLEPIKIEQVLKGKSVTKPSDGVWVFDVGQNMAGGCVIHANQPAGTQLTLTFGEMTNSNGTVYRDNMRGAKTTYTIIWPGGDRTLQTRHTYFGFRYVQVTGLNNEPTATDIAGNVFFSSAREVGKVESSNPLVENLFHCIQWNQRANMMSTGTDCPQRDERLGWAADFFEFSQTAIWNRDMLLFCSKWVQDMCDSQRADGSFPVWAPCERSSVSYSAPGWADVGLLMPWVLYRNYGDTRLLERVYANAVKWMEFVATNNPDCIWRNQRGQDFGEWLNGDTLILSGYPTGVSEMPKEMFATAFHAFSAKTLAKIATVLGKTDEATYWQTYFEKVRSQYRATYLKADGTLTTETQAGYALTLNFGLAEESEREFMIARIRELISNYNNHLSTGIHATHRLLMELSKSGEHAEANRILNLRTVPSWGYMLDQGATTLWERWDGYVVGRGFQNPGMNSFNHWVFGSVGEWIWRTLIGLNPDDSAPGYRHVVIAPQVDETTSSIAGTYNSIRGTFKITSNWQPKTGAYTLSLTIPPNTTATVYVPCTQSESLKEGNAAVAMSAGVKQKAITATSVELEVTSGTYQFTSIFKR